MSKRLAVKLKPKAEKEIKKGHPWVFSDSVSKLNLQGDTGDVAILFDNRNNKPYAVGLFDADSPICIKIVHSGSGARLDEPFFAEKLEKAFEIRKPLLRTDTNAYRFIFGENDGLPGMILDIYDSVGVLKLYSGIWFPFMELLIPKIVELTQIKALVLRMSRNLEKTSKTYKEGDVLYGELTNPEVIFKEYGVRFKVDVLLGHKTGFFLDHRANRKRVGELAKGKTVLDVFSYAGGFSVHALKGGATEVTSVDFSKQALELAKENASLNPHAGKHSVVDGDAFEILERFNKEGRKFDIVVIDPPSFAKSAKERIVAKKKYAELLRLGVKLTQKNGILLLASCSSRITADEFRQIHNEEFKQLGVSYHLEEFTEHDIDHPIGFEEGAYLKSMYYVIG